MIPPCICVTCGVEGEWVACDYCGQVHAPNGWGEMICYEGCAIPDSTPHVECPSCVVPGEYAGIDHRVATEWNSDWPVVGRTRGTLTIAKLDEMRAELGGPGRGAKGIIVGH